MKHTEQFCVCMDVATGSLLHADGGVCILRSLQLTTPLIPRKQGQCLLLLCAVLEQCLWGTPCSLSGRWIIFTSCPFTRPSLAF